VVGKMGRKMPKNPSARLSTATPRNSHCTHWGSGAASVEGGGLGGTDMGGIVPLHNKD
jgi:hypothetical protein